MTARPVISALALAGVIVLFGGVTDMTAAGEITGSSESLADLDIQPMPMPAWQPPQLDGETSGNAVVYDPQTGAESVVPMPSALGMPRAATSAGSPRRSAQTRPRVGLGLDGAIDLPATLMNFSALTRVDDPSLWPYRQNVRLLMRYGKSWSACSGALIDERHVMTAAHCVFMWNSMVPANQRVCPGGATGSCWADEIQVIPGYRARTAPYGISRNAQVLAFEEFTMSANVNWDVAFVFLDRAVGVMTGHLDYGYDDNDDFYLTETFRNPGYPAARPYNGEHMYDSSGSYDQVQGVSLMFSRGSYGGQSGSVSYTEDGEGNGVGYAVASTASERATRHVRMNARQFSAVGEFIETNMPDSADLSIIDINVSPATVSAGDALTKMNYLIPNYSAGDWDGKVRARYFLSDDENIGGGDRLLKSTSYDLSVSAGESQRVTEDSPPVIPESYASGKYYVGVFLDVNDADKSNNTSLPADVAQITIVGAGGAPTDTPQPIPGMTATPGGWSGPAYLPAAYR